MSLHAVSSYPASPLPVLLSRQEWELLFASVRARLEQSAAASPEEAEPAEAMTRIRGEVLECAEALRKLQILLPPPRPGFRDTE